jgi:hypothetical protein
MEELKIENNQVPEVKEVKEVKTTKSYVFKSEFLPFIIDQVVTEKQMKDNGYNDYTIKFLIERKIIV